jgi:site-specific DNA-methyltransferase (adenine-specific)
MLGAYQAAAGESWIRAGFWRDPARAPQFTGDRPGQPGDAIAIMHRPGRKRWNGGGRAAFWNYPRVITGRCHPTQKPEPLLLDLVSLFTDPGEVILDPYFGSGTTAAAARALGRRCIGVEIDPAYVLAARARLGENTYEGPGAAAGTLFAL